jgi:RNA polymerase sigma factor (sigma-70 family)
MTLVDDGSTSSTLLSKVADWENHPAWVRFKHTYDPFLWRWCRGHGLDEDSIDEVCQRIWIDLSERMKTFEYDPSRTFRGWLRRVCDSRVIDFLRQRKAAVIHLSLDEGDLEQVAGECRTAIEPPETDECEDRGLSDPFRRFLLREGEKVQAAVRARVKPHNWDAFWLVAVCDWTVERTGTALGMSVCAVYAARERVARMLREEGQRVSERWPAVS